MHFEDNLAANWQAPVRPLFIDPLGIADRQTNAAVAVRLLAQGSQVGSALVAVVVVAGLDPGIEVVDRD